MTIGQWRERIAQRLRLDAQAWEGAGRLFAEVGWLLLLFLFVLTLWPIFNVERMLGVGALMLIGIGVAIAGLLLIWMLKSRAVRFWWGVLLLTAMLLLLLGGGDVAVKGQAAVVLTVLMALGLLGGGTALIRASGWTWRRAVCIIAGGLSLLALITLLILPGWDVEANNRPSVTTSLDGLPDPGLPGALAFRRFTYGSGTDRQRSEFASGVTLRSRSVDGARLIDGWEGASGWARTRYWGFDAKALPLNGRVWMPEGAGPFPVVLIVHGNHHMEDFSDLGYAWLGEQFASHGVVAVSVDENFLNSGFSDLLAGLDGGLDTENDARGWMLLEHLRQLREWNQTKDNVFAGKLDLDRVVLIGHSRGGEAVAEAALFNRLPAFPDDARQTFDYHFGIQGLIAIAPVDGQYDPRGRKTRIEDVNYLVIHGSLDGDVQSFMGTSQFARVTFPECVSCFKSSVYVLGANHGQFNTGWGRSDSAMPGRLFLNLEPIMDEELQRSVARPLFTAFLLTTLFGRDEYRSVFEAVPRSAPWIAQPVELITDFRTGDELVIADFEEDADLQTATLGAARIESQGLSRWSEAEVQLKWEPLDSAAVRLGWNSSKDAQTPLWRVGFDASPAAFTALSFSLAMTEDSPLDDEEAEWKTPDSLDLSVVVMDRNRESVIIPLAGHGALPAPVHTHTRKHPWLDDTDTAEPLFTRYRIKSGDLSPLDLSQLESIEFRFDRSEAGVVLLDDLTLTPAPVAVEPIGIDEGG